MLDYYELLGVPPNSPEHQIRSSYRQRIRTLHPDRFGGDAGGLAMARQMSTLLNLAWDTLGRPAARADYDRRLGSPGRPDAPPAAPGARASTAGPRTRSQQAWSAAEDADADDRLLDVLTEAEQRALRAADRVWPPGAVATLVRPLRSGALAHRVGARTEDGTGAGRTGLSATAGALAVGAACRDVLDDDRLDPGQRRLLRLIAEGAGTLLGAPVAVDSGSWLERGVRPPVRASARRRLAQKVSGAGVLFSAVAAATAGLDLHAGHGTPWVPLIADGVAHGPGTAVAGTTLLIALGAAFGTLVGSRWLASGGGAAIPARPTVVVHLDAVDRVRFAAGRRFRTLPDRPPMPASATR